MYIYLDKRSYTIRTRKQWTQTKIKMVSNHLFYFRKKMKLKKIQLFIYYENPKTFGQSYVYQPIVSENDQNAQKN